MNEDNGDAMLAAAFRDGDPEALGGLMRRYQAPLFGYLLRLTGRRDAADDLFQEVFLKLVRNPAAYDERQKFKAWLFTVAHNAAMDFFRREAARRLVWRAEGDLPGAGGASASADAPRGPLETAASAEPGPQQAAENRALGERIDAALLRLSEDQREVFYLRHYSELSFKEIAEMLGLPIGTVLARMSRAAAALRRELGDEAQ